MKDQTAVDSLMYSFEQPSITMLSSDGGANKLGSGCTRDGYYGCGLTTDGGYIVTIIGVNFGLNNQVLEDFARLECILHSYLLKSFFFFFKVYLFQ